MDTLQVDLIINDGSADVVIGKNRQKLGDFVREVESKTPTLNFKVDGAAFIDLDKLEKKAQDTRKSFQSIAAARFDSGQINGLTRDIVKASERSRELESIITTIKRQLQDPNRKSSIRLLTDELRAAEIEADSLNRKLSALPNGSSASGGAGRSANLRLSSFQKTNLGYQANDIATMAALGASPAQILASQGGQIAQIFSAEQIAAFTARYAALLPVLGAGTAAIALTYKITGDIRDRAEQRLKTEEKITAEVNKQLLGAKELKDAFEAHRRDAAEARRLQDYQQNASITEIMGRRALLDKIAELNPLNKNIPAYRSELLALDAQIADFNKKQRDQKTSGADSVFAQNFENRKRLEEEESRRIEKERAEAAEKFKKSVEQGKEKVKEMAKTWETSFENIFQKRYANNPFVQMTTDADRALQKIRELPPELQKTALALQMQVNLRALIEAQLDNQLGIFDLRNDANNFRNPYNAEKDKQNQEKYIQRYLYDNPNYLYLKRHEYDAIERTSGYKNTQSFEDFYRKDILRQGNSIFDTPANRLNKKLEDQYDLIYRTGQNAEQKAFADRKFISATAGANPLDLSDKNRERAAIARENEAARRESFERESLQVDKDKLAVLKQIDANQKKLLEIAGKGGIEALKTQIEIVDKTNGGANVLGASPKPSDMLGTVSGPGGLTNF